MNARVVGLTVGGYSRMLAVMTTEALAPATGLTAYVAAEIRAYLGRHSIPKSELARRLEVDNTWVGKRLNGRTEITLTDVERIATALGTRPTLFLPRGDGGLPASSPQRQPVDPLASRVVAVGGETRRTSPVRATRTHRPAAPVRPLTPALV